MTEFINEFKEYMEIFIDPEEFKVMLILIIFTAIILFSSWFGEKYGEILNRAYEKNKNGESLTRKERKVLDGYENYKKNSIEKSENKK